MQINIPETKILIGINILLIIIVIIMYVIISMLPKNCPEQKIIKIVETKNPLDIQFSRENFPSKVHNEMFIKSTPWIGGYGLGIGKTYVRRSQEQKK